MQIENHGGSDKLLRHIQERSDDIEKVIIPQTEHVSIGGTIPAPFPPGIIICLINGEQWGISKEDAEIILNDGILNRMKIKIQIGF
jgi:hypothetical protein